ncbi:MAG: hypothetical protein ACE5K7_04310, partial [Phycisphaerae bacterium]
EEAPEFIAKHLPERKLVVAVLNWLTGQLVELLRLPPGAILSRTVLSDNAQRLIVAVRFVGRSWNLFDLYLVSVPNRTGRLLRSDVLAAISPESNYAPDLSLTFLDNDHIAFVETRVSRRSPAGQPLDGRYWTVIIRLPTGRTISRQAHPHPGLSPWPPRPYLPDELLARLNLPLPSPVPAWPATNGAFGGSALARPGGLWKRFFQYRAGRLWLADGTGISPAAVDMFQLSPGRSVLAARWRPNAKPDRNVLLVIFEGPGRTYRFSLRPIVALHWLAASGGSSR